MVYFFCQTYNLFIISIAFKNVLLSITSPQTLIKMKPFMVFAIFTIIRSAMSAPAVEEQQRDLETSPTITFGKFGWGYPLGIGVYNKFGFGCDKFGFDKLGFGGCGFGKFNKLGIGYKLAYPLGLGYGKLSLLDLILNYKGILG